MQWLFIVRNVLLLFNYWTYRTIALSIQEKSVTKPLRNAIVIDDVQGADKFQDLDACLCGFNRQIQTRFLIFSMQLNHFVSVRFVHWYEKYRLVQICIAYCIK
jgi:hypothetical protein